MIRARRLRTLATAALCGFVLLAMSSASWGDSSAATTPVLLSGAGSWGPYEELVPWQNDLSSSSSPITLRYTDHGTVLGRQDFLAGVDDFVLTATPFTADELASAKKSVSDFIEAPVQVSSLAMLLSPPTFLGSGFHTQTIRCDPDDPSTWPKDVTDGSTQCVVNEPYNGPFKITAHNLAAMLMRDDQPEQGMNVNAWNNPQVLQSLGVPNLLVAKPQNGPAPVLRSDGDETSYFLQHYLETTAPEIWSAMQKANPQLQFDPITERMALHPYVSRDGAQEQSHELASHFGGDPLTGDATGGTSGVIAALPASSRVDLATAFPNTTIYTVQIQNANGDWVAPTTDSINKAVDAGGDNPLYAMTNKVPGAYPLVWVDHLYAPAHGLSQQKTEALATTIRYLVTTGQSAAPGVGEGQLPPSLVQQALAAADHLVASNCTQAGEKIESSSDPGPMAPKRAAMNKIGTMLHCVATEPATTTTVTESPTGPTGSDLGTETGSDLGDTSSADLSGSSGDSSGGTGANGSGATPGGTTATGATRGGGTTADAVLTASKLPLPDPVSVPASDRLATFLLGVGLYFLLRKPAAALARRAFR